MRAEFRALALGAATLVAASLDATSARADDEWFGVDKALHFGVSAALGGGGYAASAPLVREPWQRAAIGAGFSLTLGAGKELYDLSGHGDPSWKDFTWDVIGTAFGVGIALLVDAAIRSSSPDRGPARTEALELRF